MYSYDTLTVAKKLLGSYLIHETKQETTIGKIVETEAYLDSDPGSHSHKGKTKRNQQMFESAGTAYVYLIYGMYYCFNVVTNKKHTGEAVLIRALEPIEGIELMKKRRQTNNIKSLCSGPGKLAQAMGITKKQNGYDLKTSNLRIQLKKTRPKIHITTRIGITKGAHLPYRFYIKDNEFISKK